MEINVFRGGVLLFSGGVLHIAELMHVRFTDYVCSSVRSRRSVTYPLPMPLPVLQAQKPESSLHPGCVPSRRPLACPDSLVLPADSADSPGSDRPNTEPCIPGKHATGRWIQRRRPSSLSMGRRPPNRKNGTTPRTEIQTSIQRGRVPACTSNPSRTELAIRWKF